MRCKTLARAFGLVIFLGSATLAPGQTSSPQDSPTSKSAGSSPSKQSSDDAAALPSLRIGGDAAQASLAYQVSPVYPPLAKSAHISGTVRLHCIIGKDGSVQELEYVSGPPLLMKSAIDAVRQWRFKPTFINGAQVRVDTTVSVVFALDGSPSSQTAPQETKPIATDQYTFQGYVNDFAGVINSEDKSQLDLIAEDIDQKEDIQLAFVTIESLDGQPIKEFATQLANRWGVGRKESNRGLMILLSVRDRQYRIVTGRGLESALSDEEADRLGREMVPMLRAGDFGKALLHLAQRIQVEIPPQTK